MVAKVAETAKSAEIADIDKNAEIAKIAEIAALAKVAEIPEISQSAGIVQSGIVTLLKAIKKGVYFVKLGRFVMKSSTKLPKNQKSQKGQNG